jgi:hypothetical protein
MSGPAGALAQAIPVLVQAGAKHGVVCFDGAAFGHDDKIPSGQVFERAAKGFTG